jgi:hypothetical protein
LGRNRFPITYSRFVPNNPTERAPRLVGPGRRNRPSAEGTAEAGGPGLSIELDEDAQPGKLGYGWKNRESYDADGGSVVDRCGFLPHSHESGIVG